jgi:hypothetical protein
VKIVLAKLFGVTAAGLGYGVATVLASTVGAVIVFKIRDIEPALAVGRRDPAGAGSWRRSAVALWGLIGLGRRHADPQPGRRAAGRDRGGVDHRAGARAGAGACWTSGSVAKFLPTQATTAIVQPAQPEGSDVDFSMLPWWGGGIPRAAGRTR